MVYKTSRTPRVLQTLLHGLWASTKRRVNPRPTPRGNWTYVGRGSRWSHRRRRSVLLDPDHAPGAAASIVAADHPVEIRSDGVRLRQRCGRTQTTRAVGATHGPGPKPGVPAGIDHRAVCGSCEGRGSPRIGFVLSNAAVLGRRLLRWSGPMAGLPAAPIRVQNDRVSAEKGPES